MEAENGEKQEEQKLPIADPQTVKEEDRLFSSEQMGVLMAMFDKVQLNMTETIRLSVEESVRNSYTSDNGPTPIDQATVEDAAYQDDVLKILQRHEDPVIPTTEEKEAKEINFIDRRIAQLQGDLGLDEELTDLESSLKRNKVQDMSATMAKSWQQRRMRDDITHFPAWHRIGIAYFNAVGFNTVGLMDPFKVPKCLKDWEEQDRIAMRSPFYRKFAKQVVQTGEVSNCLTREDDFVVLNAAYLATQNFRRGLRASATAVVESSIDFHTMKSCLLRANELSHPAAARHMFFNVFNYFMLNTEETRLQRLNDLTTNSAQSDNESIKNFADRISAEADILNMMSRDVVVSSALLLSVFKKAILGKYESSTTKFYTELRLLESSNKNYDLDELTQKWNAVWLEERGKVGHPVANVLSAKVDTRAKGKKTNTAKVMGKDGKFVCFQFMKNGSCTFGQNCRYSHQPPDDAAMFISYQDIELGINEQAYVMGLVTGKDRIRRERRDHGAAKHKERHAKRKDHKSRTKRTNTITSSYQSAVERHRRRKGESANLTASQTPDPHSEASDSDSSSHTVSSDTEVSDSDSETVMMLSLQAAESPSTPQDNITNLERKKEPLPVPAKKNATSCKKIQGILDSGASVHVCGDRKLFVGEMKGCNVVIKCANNEVMRASRSGDVAIQVGPNKKRIWLRDVLYIPKVPMLVSIGRLATDSGINILFRGEECMLVEDATDQPVCNIARTKAKNSGLLYTLECEIPHQVESVIGKCRRELVFSAYSTYIPRSRNLMLLHARYNHASEYYIRKLSPRCKGKWKWCDACVVGGISKRRFKKSTRYEPYRKNAQRFGNKEQQTKTAGFERAALTLEQDVTDDTFGIRMSWDAKTSPIVSVRGNKYGFIGVCSTTKVAVPLLGSHRSDFPGLLKPWLKRYKNNFSTYPRQLVFDQGGENMNKMFLNWIKEQGIQVLFSTTGSSNQNAQVERQIRTVWTSMLKLLAHSGVPFQFWCYAFVYATLVGNHIPHRALAFRSPLEVAGFSTVHDRIFTWGCEAWHMDPRRMQHEAKSKRGVLLGIDEEIKGWQILDIETRKVVVTRNVVFNEYRYPFKDHLKPCLIMLKFGTWPKSVRPDVMGNSIDPATLVQVTKDDIRNGGLKPDTESQDSSISATPLHTPATQLHTQSNKTDSRDEVSEPMKIEVKDNDAIEEPSFPMSPIISDSMAEDFSSPGLFDEDADESGLGEQQTINLDTPPLKQQAAKKWSKFKDNHYYQSASPRTLEFYEKKLAQESQPATHSHSSKPLKKKMKILKPKPIPLTPVPEDEVKGEPAWNVKEIKKSRPSKIGDGTREYYVRWQGSWPDEWLHESHLDGCPDLLDEFNKPKRKYNKSQEPKAEKKLREGKRRSSRLKSKLNFETTNKACTEFPLPPDYSVGPHHHWIPYRISEDHQIASSLQEIEKLTQDERFEKKPENRAEMLRGNRVKEYLEAEEKELYELDKNRTFEVVECPKGRRPIPCRWVYDIKRKSNGEIERFKARLVVQGFRQIEGVDFQNTFSAVSQMRTFRLMVALSVCLGLRITQYDISNAFLHAELDKEIYMTLPPGYPLEQNNPSLVFKLIKGLYGLKQASRLWNKLLSKAFKKAGLELATTEPGVFFVKGGPLCIINLHVDDYNIATADEGLRKKIEKVMSEAFSVKAMGDLKLFLGIVVEPFEENGRTGVILHQKPYHERAIAKYGLEKSKPAKTPAEASVKLSVLDCPETDDKGKPINAPPWPYMNVGGTLMYSACATRPDISQRVTQLARYNKNPGATHVKAQKHLLKYVKNDPRKGVIFTRKLEGHNFNAPIKILAFCDSDWAGCSDTRRSTIGYVIHVAGGPITWKSQLKKTLALSSCEAEFMALSEVARELMWLIKFLDEIGVEHEVPEIYCDSQSAIYWSEDPVQHQRNKHIELKYYFIRDVVGKRLVKVFKINTLNNVADLMTKPATKTMTENLVPAMMGKVPPVLEE